MVDTVRDFDLLVRGRAAVTVAIPVREAREKSAAPARKPVVKARRVNALETDDSNLLVAELDFMRLLRFGFTAFDRWLLSGTLTTEPTMPCQKINFRANCIERGSV